MIYFLCSVQLVSLWLIVLILTRKSIKKPTLISMPEMGGKPFASPSGKRKAKVLDDSALWQQEQDEKKAPLMGPGNE